MRLGEGIIDHRIFFFAQYRFDRSACSPAVTFTSDSRQYDLTIGGGDISTGSRRLVKKKKVIIVRNIILTYTCDRLHCVTGTRYVCITACSSHDRS